MSLNHILDTSRGLTDSFDIGCTELKVKCDDGNDFNFKLPSQATVKDYNIISDGAGKAVVAKTSIYNFEAKIDTTATFNPSVGTFTINDQKLKYIKMDDLIILSGHIQITPTVPQPAYGFVIDNYPYAPAGGVTEIGEITAFQETTQFIGNGALKQVIGLPTRLEGTFNLISAVPTGQPVFVAFNMIYKIPTP
jgi:hypothetical protein